MSINNVQVNSILNDAFEYLTGGTGSGDPLETGDFVDGGKAYADFSFTREQFTNALINVIYRNWYSDSSYRSAISSPYYEDEAQYGAILQSIHAEMPAAQAALNWQSFTSGTSTVGTYTVYIPTVYSKLYDKSASWQIPIFISGSQLDTAFKSEQDINTYIAYLFLAMDNAIVSHIEAMDFANRNNFMAEKIHTSADGVHAINLVASYQADAGITTAITVEDFLNDADALRYAGTTIQTYAEYMEHMSETFNVDGYKRFTPKDRLVVEVLSRFEKAYNNIVKAQSFHDGFLDLPLYRTTPYWEQIGDTTFDDVSAIAVELADGTTVSQDGIVAFLADKWAIMHTIRQHRVASKVFEPEDLTAYYYQFRDSYVNDLSQNAIVFYLADVAAP